MPHTRVIRPGHDRKRSLGWLAVAWMEHFCVHGPGDIVGVPLSRKKDGIPLSLDLTAYTVDCYALDETGRRLYDECWLIRPKGCDKSGHAARIATFEGLGPCRFNGWARGGEVFKQGDFSYVYRAGEPMGKGVATPFIRIMATEESQTGNVYDVIYYNLLNGPLRQFFRYADDIGLTRINLPNGEIRPSTASSSAKDGGRETHAVADEAHLYITPETRGMYETVDRNLVKLKEAEPWMNGVSTMYAPGQRSTLEDAHNYVKDVEAGKIERWSVLWDYRYAPSTCNKDSPDAVLRAGLAEAYGDAISYMDVQRLIDKLRDPRKDPVIQQRLFLNQANAGSDLAFDPVSWRNNKRDRVVPKGALVTLGFDGSRTQDATALIGTEVETGHQWRIGIWERPANAAPNWTMPIAPIHAAVDEAFDYFNVYLMYADPSKWETELAGWAGKYGQKRVIALPPAMSRRTALMFAGYSGAIRSGDVTNDGDPLFAAHIGNSHKFTLTAKDDDGNQLWIIQKDTQMGPRKIDAAWAGAASWQARLDAVAAGAKAPGGWVVV